MLDILKRILGAKAKGDESTIASDPKALHIYVRCIKCREVLHLRIRKTDEVQRDLDGKGYSFYVQKHVMGNRCYNQIPIRIEMDEAYRVINKTAVGGEFVTKNDYEAYMEGRNQN